MFSGSITYKTLTYNYARPKTETFKIEKPLSLEKLPPFLYIHTLTNPPCQCFSFLALNIKVWNFGGWTSVYIGGSVTDDDDNDGGDKDNHGKDNHNKVDQN